MNLAFYRFHLEIEGPVKSSRKQTKGLGGCVSHVLGFVCLCLSPIDRNLLEHLPCVWVAGEIS